jgi:hypothetical protein
MKLALLIPTLAIVCIPIAGCPESPPSKYCVKRQFDASFQKYQTCETCGSRLSGDAGSLDCQTRFKGEKASYGACEADNNRKDCM